MTDVSRMLPLGVLVLSALSFGACNDADDPLGLVPPGEGVLSGNITGTRTLRAETTYTVSGFLKVQDGGRLVIPAGTRLVGDPGVLGSAVFVLPGGQIDARGTAEQPIVFTSASPVNSRAPGDWGGLVLVGRARSNRTGSVIVEGSDANVPNGGPPGIVYTGGAMDDDNSGTLRYVRVEFAGYGVAQNVELNSFTFAAVGRGTTLEYLQALAGLDDHFEWFGGTVDARYLVSYESADDHFDAAEGFRGRLQHLIGLQTTVIPPRSGAGQTSQDPQGFELDGCDTGSAGCPQGHASAPFNVPLFANFSLIGPGPGVLPSGGGRGILVRRGTGGVWINGVIARYPTGIEVRDTATFNRIDADSLILSNILLADNTAATASNVAGRTVPTTGLEMSTASTSALFTSVPPAGSEPTVAALDFTPAPGSPLASGGMNSFSGVIAARAGSFIQPTTYRGAAATSGVNVRWWQGWTVYARR